MKRTAKGELLSRIKLSRKRLSCKMYSYPEVFNQNSSWPGDWEGRCILALTSLYFAFNGYPKEQESIKSQLKEIVIHLKDYVNKDGYFGELVNDSYVNEQQISGNSWYLRGLIEYYQISGEEEILSLIKRIEERYLFKIAKFYVSYPLEEREKGGVGGHLEDKPRNGWLTSSDVGCAFIMLDAMSEVYYLLRDPRLKEILESIIEVFLSIDFVNLECQTHATLSCARGILTFYRASQEKKYLSYAENIFSRYINEGMTKDYSNLNWFKRPDTWTEPCCIVDSFMLAGELFEITGDKKYLVLLNRIYLNSFRMAQRSNGGAGCNTCLTESQSHVHGFIYEAFFCCTMRFPEGLRFAKKYASSWKEGALLINLLSPQEIELEDGAKIIVKGDIYQKKEAKISFANVKQGFKTSIYVPSTVPFEIKGTETSYEDERISFEVKGDLEVTIRFNPTVHPEGKLLFAGDMLLVKRSLYPDTIRYEHEGETLYYLVDYRRVKGKNNVLNLVQKL